MTHQRDGWLFPLAFILGGLAVGGMFVLLFSRGWDVAWVETAGTWFGAVATVLTLAWAVHLFRSDQRQRVKLEEEKLRAAAAMVVPDIRSGTGSGGGPTDIYIEYLMMTIFNDSPVPIWVRSFAFPSLSVRSSLPTATRIGPGEQWNGQINFEPISVPTEEFHRSPVGKLNWTMEFESSGVAWTKTSDDIHAAERLPTPARGYADEPRVVRPAGS